MVVPLTYVPLLAVPLFTRLSTVANKLHIIRRSNLERLPDKRTHNHQLAQANIFGRRGDRINGETHRFRCNIWGEDNRRGRPVVIELADCYCLPIVKNETAAEDLILQTFNAGTSVMHSDNLWPLTCQIVRPVVGSDGGNGHALIPR